MSESRSFRSLHEALRFMETEVDRPAEARNSTLDNGFVLRAFPHFYDDGTFTNVYDLSWAPGHARASFNITARPEEVLNRARSAHAAATAAFFLLVDDASGLPPQTSLNLAIDRGRVLSLPVVDRQVVLARAGDLTTDYVTADGDLELNGRRVTWTGSRTGRTAQSYAYGNGNIVITRQDDPSTGGVRVLHEPSRWTPSMSPTDPWTDVGFAAAGDGTFRSTATAEGGNLDIFAHDVVLRCRTEHLVTSGTNTLSITRIGMLQENDLPDFAVSVGPALHASDLLGHSVNHDPSLASPSFTDDRRVRMVLYYGGDDRTHIRLYDGRPGSLRFTGAKPDEARDIIAWDTGYQWGCFLDGGQTAKLWVVEDGNLTSYGNRHYLRWPQAAEEDFTWVPDTGRPVSSSISFRAAADGALAMDYGAQDLRFAEDMVQHAGPAEAVTRAGVGTSDPAPGRSRARTTDGEPEATLELTDEQRAVLDDFARARAARADSPATPEQVPGARRQRAREQHVRRSDDPAPGHSGSPRR